jgi:DNA ligase (NAD+)
MGNCEKLLSVCPLEKVFELSRKEIVSIKGFSEKIADAMISGLAASTELFAAMSELGFNLNVTPISAPDQELTDGQLAGKLAGKLIVCTGAMQSGSREEMKKQAKELGARVGGSITGKTDMLVCGERVGAAKLNKAEALGVQLLSETEYLSLIN